MSCCLYFALRLCFEFDFIVGLHYLFGLVVSLLFCGLVGLFVGYFLFMGLIVLLV